MDLSKKSFESMIVKEKTGESVVDLTEVSILGTAGKEQVGSVSILVISSLDLSYGIRLVFCRQKVLRCLVLSRSIKWFDKQ